MKKQKEKEFRFIGTGSSYLNSCGLGLVKEICDSAGVKLAVGKDPFVGCSQNLVLKKNAKLNKNGFYNEKDVIARFDSADRCTVFLTGMSALAKLRKRKR